MVYGKTYVGASRSTGYVVGIHDFGPEFPIAENKLF